MTLILNGSAANQAAYKFRTLPTLEADVGDNDMVWEFNGGASANETAVPGVNVPLAGSDLVATQNGGIAAATGGGRPIGNNSYQYFSASLGFWNAFLTATDGFALLWQMKNFATFSTPGQLWLAYLRFNTGIYHEPLANVTNGLLYAGWKGLSAESSWYSGTYQDLLPADGTSWMLLSHDPVNNLGFCGLAVGPQQPKSLRDFGWFNIITGNLAPAATVSSFYNGNRNALVGGGSSSPSLGQTIVSFSAQLGPSVFKV